MTQFPKIFPDEVIDFVFGGPEPPFDFNLSFTQYVTDRDKKRGAEGYVDVDFAVNEGPEENRYMIRILVKPEPETDIIRTQSLPRRRN